MTSQTKEAEVLELSSLDLETKLSTLEKGQILEQKYTAVLKINAKRDYKQRAFFTAELQSSATENFLTIQLVLEQKNLNAGKQNIFKPFLNLMNPGSVVKVTASPGLSQTGEVSLFAFDLELLSIGHDPAHITRLLQYTNEGLFSKESVQEMLQCNEETITDLLHLSQSKKPQDKQTFKKKLIICSRIIEGRPINFSRNGKSQFTPAQAALLTKVESECNPLWSVEAVEISSQAKELSGAESLENMLQEMLDPAISIPNSNEVKRKSYIEHKKKPQIQWLLLQLMKMSKEHNSAPAGDSSSGIGSFAFKHIIDVGGGRGDLALAIAKAFPGTKVTVLDINEPSLLAGKQRAVELKLANIEFILCDVFDLLQNTSSSQAVLSSDVDLFVGLHACGGLTDVILNLAVRQQASFLICTCCFCKNIELCKKLQTISCSAASATSTQAEPLRGCDVMSQVWWGDYSEEEKMLVMQRAETHDDMPTARRSMRIINSCRLNLTKKQLKEQHPLLKMQDIHLKSFPESFSLKNLVLYGNIIT